MVPGLLNSLPENCDLPSENVDDRDPNIAPSRQSIADHGGWIEWIRIVLQELKPLWRIIYDRFNVRRREG